MEKYTFFIKTDWLDINAIKEVFNDRQNWEEYKGTGHLNFFYRDGKFVYDKSLYQIKSELANIRNNTGKGIANKRYLYDLFYEYDKELCHKFMAEQYYINHSNYKIFDLKNKLWILKPIKGFSGAGISIITNQEDLDNAIKKTSKYNEYVIAEYINNPLLIKDRKFHMRVHILLYEDLFYFDRNCEMLTAKKPYFRGDYFNKEIHDTHAKSTIPNLFFADTSKDYFPERMTEYVIEQMKELFYHIKKINTYKCYEESKHCFEVYGADILITDDYRIKLLEINDKIALDKGGMFKNYFNGIMEMVVDKIFPPITKPEFSGYFYDPNNFIPPNKTPYKTYYIEIDKNYSINNYKKWNQGEILHFALVENKMDYALIDVSNSIVSNIGIVNNLHLFEMIKLFDYEIYKKYIIKHIFITNVTRNIITENDFNNRAIVFEDIQTNDTYDIDSYEKYNHFMDKNINRELIAYKKYEIDNIFYVNFMIYNNNCYIEKNATNQVTEILNIIKNIHSNKNYLRVLFNKNISEYDILSYRHYYVFTACFGYTGNKIKLLRIKRLSTNNILNNSDMLEDILHIIFGDIDNRKYFN